MLSHNTELSCSEAKHVWNRTQMTQSGKYLLLQGLSNFVWLGHEIADVLVAAPPRPGHNMRSAANALETVDAKTDHRLNQPIVASAPMTELMRLAKRAATSDAKVLITGESG